MLQTKIQLESIQNRMPKYRRLLKDAKKMSIEEKYRIAKVMVKKLFQLVSKLTSATKQKSLLEYSNPTELTNDFTTFFKNKIKKIRDTLDHHPIYRPTDAKLPKFAHFGEMLENAVLTVMKKMPAKSCELDAWEASLMKKAFPKMNRTNTKLVNLSLAEGVFTSKWKTALLKPLLKKILLDIMEKSNYKPVSNLSFLSHLVKKCVLIQFNKHCADNTLLPEYQSTYRANYSCKTALVKMINDILWGMESQENYCSHSH